MQNPKILIVGPAWVGDMMMAQVLFKILKKHNPQVSIDVLAPAWSVSLLDRMPQVSEAIEMPIAHGKLALYQRYKLGVALRSRRYTTAYVLPNSFKSALIPFWANIPERIGYRGEMRYGVLTQARCLNKAQFPKMIERFAALGYDEAQVKNPQFLPDCPAPVLQQPSKQPDKPLQVKQQPILALCPGAEFGGSKRWPETYYAQVAQAQIKKGWGVWIIGSIKDQPVADQIMRLVNHSACMNFTGKTSLSAAIDLLAQSDLVLTNDSGLMHIAAALSKPLIAVYGSTSPGYTPPLSDKAIVLQSNIACSPCFKRECPLKLSAHHACMKQLVPTLILDQINKLEKSCVF